MASVTPTVTVDIPGHGTFSAPAIVVDMMIARHLPASPRELRAEVQKRIGEPNERAGIPDYSDVIDVTAFLVMLADWYHGELANDRYERSQGR